MLQNGIFAAESCGLRLFYFNMIIWVLFCFFQMVCCWLDFPLYLFDWIKVFCDTRHKINHFKHAVLASTEKFSIYLNSMMELD